ncbi:MAG: hypothetical protein J6A17_04795 [Bacilli bacterium]|nr:hypothetical protein [Bacilli bacterium]
MEKSDIKDIGLCLDRDLSLEEIEEVKNNENEYIRTLATQMKIRTKQDLLTLYACAHNNVIAYLLSEAQLVILKYNLEKKMKRKLSDDEILDYAEKQKPLRITASFKLLNSNLPWEEKTYVYSSISKIIKLEENTLFTAFNTDNELEYLNELKNYDFTTLSLYYYCIQNLKRRRELEKDGIKSYLEKELNDINITDEQIQEQAENFCNWLISGNQKVKNKNEKN